MRKINQPDGAHMWIAKREKIIPFPGSKKFIELSSYSTVNEVVYVIFQVSSH
jgi:hypothetical protein